MTPVPVIFEAPKQRYLVARLVRHFPEIQVITASEPSDMGYPDVANWAFLYTCKKMKGKAFLWLEADSIPLVSDWIEQIDTVWQESKKPILWSSDSNPPHDTCTGIGVYGPDILKHLPESITGQGFDGWIHQNLGHLIQTTPIIQHSYGTYDSAGKCKLHRNPVARAGAVVFHKDQYQTLLP